MLETLKINLTVFSLCLFVGWPHRPVDRAGLSGGLHGVPQGKWDRGHRSDEGDGLPGGAQSTGNIRRGTLYVF